MKKIPMKIALVFFISLVFCIDDEKYSLIPNLPEVGTKVKYHYVEEIYFELPGRGRFEHISEFDNTTEYMGEKDGFYILKLTRTNMDVDQRIGNIEDKPYDYLAMEDAPCLLYINSDGWDDHVVPVNPDDEYLQEVFEAAYIDDRGSTNFYYPFGKEAVNLSIGDSWHVFEDSVRMYINTDSPESWVTQSTTFTLKNIRKKKGKEIAVIDIKSDLTMEMNLLLYVFGERIFLTGNTTGTVDAKVQVYQSGGRHKVTEYGDLFGEMEMDGEKFNTKFTIRNYHKRVK